MKSQTDFRRINNNIMKILFVISLIILAVTGCTSIQKKNFYDAASPAQMVSFKRERLPFPTGIKFLISQGAFGKKSHAEPGNEYSWDFDVPYGTPVVSVENGTVLEVWEPTDGGGCDSKFSNAAHNIKIEHEDGTVAQYGHISAKVKTGDLVREGQEIAVTAMNGWICSPQLHFGIYRSKDHLYSSSKRETIPVSFDGLPEFGKATEGLRGEVPSGLQISIVKDAPGTNETLKLMNEFTKKYDLSPYFFTRKIQIEKFAIPHDYPILTLNTRHNKDPDFLLSTFLHEQIHRFVSGPNEVKTQNAIKELRSKFKNVPVGGKEGGFDENSTYRHLIVCWFELQADKKYLGAKRAYEIIRDTDHYTWIYKQVLAHEKEIGSVISHHGLDFYPAKEVFASNFPRVTADMRTYEETVASMVSEFKKQPEKPKEKRWVKAKLKHMFEVDQFMRNYMMNTPFKNGYSDDEKKEFERISVAKFQTIDSENTLELKRLLKIYRWFTISEFGKETDKQAWILVQHADLDPEFQKEVLAILSELVKKKQTDPSNYAYLVDRVASSFSDPTKRVPQKYGTQGHCVGPGKWEPHETEDPANLDKRRSEVGLGTEAEYMKMFKDICH